MNPDHPNGLVSQWLVGKKSVSLNSPRHLHSPHHSRLPAPSFSLLMELRALHSRARPCLVRPWKVSVDGKQHAVRKRTFSFDPCNLLLVLRVVRVARVLRVGCWCSDSERLLRPFVLIRAEPSELLADLFLVRTGT